MSVCNDTSRSNLEKTCAACTSDYATHWLNGDCQTLYSSILFNINDQIGYNVNNLTRLQDNMVNLFSTYLNGTLKSPTEPLQERLQAFCASTSQAPGVCDKYLAQNLCFQSYTNLATDSVLANWCGCYLAPPAAELSVLNTNTINSVVISQTNQSTALAGSAPCWPMCHRAGTIPLFDPATGNSFECASTVCVIDSVNSDANNLNILQACPNCTDQVCECIVSSNVVNSSSNFTQYCGTNSLCYQINSNGALIPVACNNIVVDTSPSSDNWIWWLIAIILVLAGLLIVVGFLVLISKSNKKNKTSAKNIKNS